MLTGSYARDDYSHAREASREVVKKYGVFDIKGSTIDLEENICNERRPCPVLVHLYAKMGLHRYNLLQGTKFELSRVNKYIASKGSPARTYYITLEAMDPAGGSSLQTFQTKVAEQAFGRLILRCNIARIQGETTSGARGILLDISLPEWPAENPFEKYYLVEESEVQDNEWIRLYMELAVATKYRRRELKDYGPSKLVIVKVAVDSNGEGLNSLNAVLYIRYKDLYRAPLGKEDSDHFAIVSRRFDEDKGCFSFIGAEVTPSVDFHMKALHL